MYLGRYLGTMKYVHYNNYPLDVYIELSKVPIGSMKFIKFVRCPISLGVFKKRIR
jgi:hypothetical protein